MKSKLNVFLAAAMLVLASVAVVAPSFSYAPQVFAQGTGAPGDGLNDIKGAYPPGATEDQNVGDIAKTIIDWALYLSAIVAVLFIIYGGFLYITSAGDAAQAGKGKTSLVNAIIGLVIVIMSYMIVQVVYNFLVS